MKKFWVKVCQFFSNLFGKKKVSTQSKTKKTIKVTTTKKTIDKSANERISKKLDDADSRLEDAQRKLNDAMSKLDESFKKNYGKSMFEMEEFSSFSSTTSSSSKKPVRDRPKRVPTKAELTKKMKDAVTAEKYELAAQLRDEIKALG